MKPVIIDTHAHYDNKQYNPDRDSLLSAMVSEDTPDVACRIATIINVGCDIKSSELSIALADSYPYIYATVGVHPHYSKSLSKQDIQKLEALAYHKKVIAYGEIGLDFFHNFSEPDTQRHWFKRQLELADELNLPVIIHSRDASEETFELVEKSAVRRGVVHSFSGDVALAWDYINLGFHIGIGGVVTYDKTKRLQGVVDALPMEKILLETDAPYLTPAPHRGTRNNSMHLTYVASVISEIKGVPYETVCAQTSENARLLFGI